MTDLIAPILDALLASVGEHLVPDVGRLELAPGGQVAWDDCCDGQAWVRVATIVPANTNASAAAQARCGPTGWHVSLGVGVLRCVSTVNDQGVAPSVGQLKDDTHQMTKDAEALKQAILCLDYEGLTMGGTRPNITSWTPLGPDGGCAGGEWYLSVRVDNCPCP